MFASSEQPIFPWYRDVWLEFLRQVSGNAESAFRSIRTILRNADPTLPSAYFRTLDEQSTDR